MCRVIRRVNKQGPSRTLRVYLVALEGNQLVQRAQVGIDKALASAREDGDELDTDPRDPTTSTIYNVDIPLAIVRQSLPLFVGAGDEKTPVSVFLDT